MDIKLTIVPQMDGKFVVRRDNGEYSQHAHITTHHGCKILIECVKKNKLPASAYLQGSCRRLLTEDEYVRLRAKKQRYYNVNKGVRI